MDNPFFSLSQVFATVSRLLDPPTFDNPPSQNIPPEYTTFIDSRGLVIDVRLPGVDPQRVALYSTHAEIIIQFPSKTGTINKQKYTISADYDLEKTEATMENGVLRVRVGLSSARHGPRRIVIDHAFCGRG